jgi:hypothetical protein
LARKQHLHLTLEKTFACGIVRTDWLSPYTASAAVQSRWKDASVVEDDEVVAPEQLGKAAEHQVLQLS